MHHKDKVKSWTLALLCMFSSLHRGTEGFAFIQTVFIIARYSQIQTIYRTPTDRVRTIPQLLGGLTYIGGGGGGLRKTHPLLQACMPTCLLSAHISTYTTGDLNPAI